MANIVRFDPFEDMLFPDFFRGLMRSPRLWQGTGAELQMKIDVKETDGAFKVRADIPGVRKEDINVSIDGNAITIAAEVKQEKEEKGEHTLRSERYYGSMSRSFTLASAVDEKAAVAKYTDGVLELVLPKRQDAAARKLRID